MDAITCIFYKKNKKFYKKQISEKLKTNTRLY